MWLCLQVTKFCACPTLLARTGERIASTGKFGGHQNRAPLIAQLQGNVFGEPPMKDLDRVQDQIQLLKKLSGAMKKQRDARTELEKQKQKDATFVNKKKDYEQLKKELAGVDEAIARLQCSGQDDDRLALPVQDLVRNSPRRQSLPAAPISSFAENTQRQQFEWGFSKRTCSSHSGYCTGGEETPEDHVMSFGFTSSFHVLQLSLL
ncbi:hypothetical protein HPB50_012118 [Hyalomma asiaticum]|uniref:Uncharacterized protein n=1 Tax=Hyalomma asiaticum TaxID=266040 RepID=A0ACB7RYW9_HYAAI|nr:hypothetical protein HPB50_012118 [Hyalomma asiaticum]